MGYGCASIDVAQGLTNLGSSHAVTGSLLRVHTHIDQWRGIGERACHIGEIRSLRDGVEHLLRGLAQRLIVVRLDVDRNSRIIASSSLTGKGKGADIGQVFELIAHLLLYRIL